MNVHVEHFNLLNREAIERMPSGGGKKHGKHENQLNVGLGK